MHEYYPLSDEGEGSLREVVVNKLDYDIGLNQFKLQLRHCVHFRTNILVKGMNPLSFPPYVK